VRLVKAARLASISAENDEWLRRAYAAAVVTAKDLVGDRGPIRSSTQIGRLGDPEWRWIAGAIAWAWVATRSEQAATEGWDAERSIRVTGLEPCPWSTGAIIKALPTLANACGDFDWSQPASAWSKETLAGFLSTAFELIQRAHVARDVVEEQLAGKPIAKLNTIDDDSCPF
jgi:hypothetical protein